MLIARFVRLSGAERALLLQAAALLGAVRLGLWLLPFPALRALLARGRAMPTERATHRPSPAQVVWAIEAASRYLPTTTCLTQGLVAQLLLRYYAYPSTVHIGIAQRSGNRLEAHAWVEHKGVVVIGGPACKVAAYQPLLALEDGQI